MPAEQLELEWHKAVAGSGEWNKKRGTLQYSFYLLLSLLLLLLMVPLLFNHLEEMRGKVLGFGESFGEERTVESVVLCCWVTTESYKLQATSVLLLSHYLTLIL